MAAKAPANGHSTLPSISAGADCNYLRDLSAIEHIAGFEHTARRYAASAEEYRRRVGPATATEAIADAAVASALVTLASVDARRRLQVAHVPEGSTEAIPFTRSTLIDILSDSNGNYVERRCLKLADLPAKGDALGYLYRYWLDLRGAGALRFSNIDTVHLARAGAIGSLHVIDVSSDDPLDFRFELSGYAVPLGRYEKPRAFPISIYADSTLCDYNTARMVSAPRLHRVRCRLGNTRHHYTRLILPFLDARDQVDRLCVVIRQEAGNGINIEAGDDLIAAHIGNG
jgi:hypothetical protein